MLMKSNSELQTESLKEYIWFQLLAIWNDQNIPLKEKIDLCMALSDYMNQL